MNVVQQGDLGHLPVNSESLPGTYFEVETFTLDSYLPQGKFTKEEDAQKLFDSIKTTTLKVLTCWKRPSDGKPHQVKWIRQ